VPPPLRFAMASSTSTAVKARDRQVARSLETELS
jgi:hypothetical protein